MKFVTGIYKTRQEYSDRNIQIGYSGRIFRQDIQIRYSVKGLLCYGGETPDFEAHRNG